MPISNDAEENIGYMFQNGLGVQTDYAKAMSWFVEAAAHGNSNAANQLGWMYQFGQGVKLDDTQSGRQTPSLLRLIENDCNYSRVKT